MIFLTVNDICKGGFSHYSNTAVIPKRKTSKTYGFNSFEAIMQQYVKDLADSK